MAQANFQNIHATDTTNNASAIAKRWREAREKRKNELLKVEGSKNFEGLQAFLSCVHRLTEERRLLRYLYVAEK
jgi:hypothetical protein